MDLQGESGRERPISARSGQLALIHCGKLLPLAVLESRVGFYIGTMTVEDGPCSRESAEYWPSAGQAEAALSSGQWTQRDEP